MLPSIPGRPHSWHPEPGGLFLLRLGAALPWAQPWPYLAIGTLNDFPCLLHPLPAPPFSAPSFAPSTCCGLHTTLILCTSFESVPGPVDGGHLPEDLQWRRRKV